MTTDMVKINKRIDTTFILKSSEHELHLTKLKHIWFDIIQATLRFWKFYVVIYVISICRTYGLSVTFRAYLNVVYIPSKQCSVCMVRKHKNHWQLRIDCFLLWNKQKFLFRNISLDTLPHTRLIRFHAFKEVVTKYVKLS